MGYRGTGQGYLSSHGYKVRSFPNRKREYEHRLIAAKALGRPLTKFEEVHHVDKTGANNGNHNLVICTRSFHKYLHFYERVLSLGYSRHHLAELHHVQGLPLEEIKRRLGLGEGMIGRWFRRMNIPIKPGIGGRGSQHYKTKMEMKGDRPQWVV